MPWAELFSVWGFFAVNVLTPGPNVFNTIGLALGSGRAAGLGASAGVAPGVALWGLAAEAGAAALFALYPEAQTVLTQLDPELLMVFGLRYLLRARAVLDDVLRAKGRCLATHGLRKRPSAC
jgi:Putative threonine efflux protein